VWLFQRGVADVWAFAVRMHRRVSPISILMSPVRVRRIRVGTVLVAERVDTLYSTVVGEGRFTVNVFLIAMLDLDWNFQGQVCRVEM
jgi:hypothetical protein